MFDGISFAQADFFYILLIIPPIIVWYILKQNNLPATIQFSSIKEFVKTPQTIRIYLRHLPFVFRLLTFVLLTIILARPQSSKSWENVTTEGIDIIMAMDVSSSMLAKDFAPDRLEAAKDVATQFISGRENDRLGLVVFSGESYTQCPLTTDKAVLINLMKELKCGMIEDGTAIGLGLANAVSRLKQSDAISKVVILLTDGENNRGDISPKTAADIANTYGIRVYTVGVGTIGTAPYPVQTPFGIRMQNVPVKIDEAVLKDIAKVTDGKYFRATGKNKLKQIYKEIDALEKSKIEVKEYSRKKEEYLKFAILAAISLLIEIILRYTILRTIP